MLIISLQALWNSLSYVMSSWPHEVGFILLSHFVNKNTHSEKLLNLFKITHLLCILGCVCRYVDMDFIFSVKLRSTTLEFLLKTLGKIIHVVFICKKISSFPFLCMVDYILLSSDAFFCNYVFLLMQLLSLLTHWFYLFLPKWKLLSCVWLFATSWTIQSMEFSGPEYWSG